MAASALISKRHPQDRRTRLLVWGAFWALQIGGLAVALPSVGTEAGIALALMEIGLSGSLLTALLRESPDARGQR